VKKRPIFLREEVVPWNRITLDEIACREYFADQSLAELSKMFRDNPEFFVSNMNYVSNSAMLPLLRIVNEQCDSISEMREMPERALLLVISLAAMRDPCIARTSLDVATSEELVRLAIKWMEIFEASDEADPETSKIGSRLRLAIKKATGVVID